MPERAQGFNVLRRSGARRGPRRARAGRRFAHPRRRDACRHPEDTQQPQAGLTPGRRSSYASRSARTGGCPRATPRGWAGSTRALALRGAGEHPALRVRALCSKALIAWPLWLQAETGAAVEEAERTARELGDPLTLSLALQVRARIDASEGHTDLARHRRDGRRGPRLATAANDPWAIAMAAYATAITANTIERQRTCVAAGGNAAGRSGQRLPPRASARGLLLQRDVPRQRRRRPQTYARRVDDLLPDDGRPASREFILSSTGFVTLITGDTDAAERAFRELVGLGGETTRPPGRRATVCSGSRPSPRSAATTTVRPAHRRCDEPPRGRPTGRGGVTARRRNCQPARARHGASAWDAAVRAGEALA